MFSSLVYSGGFSKTSNYLFIGVLFCILPSIRCDCKLLQPSNQSDIIREKELLDVISPLKGKVFETKDDQYTYKVSICDNIKNEAEGVGAVQHKGDKTFSLGRYNMTDIIGGTGWILLIYHGGDVYKSYPCTNASRVTNLMIICDPDAAAGKLEILEERKKNAIAGCYYLFELNSNVSCKSHQNPAKLPYKGLSSGGVFCVLFFTCAIVYLVCGFLYKRFIIGAKGLEQIPNYTFWRDFGNLQADGCDYFCRCGPRKESQAYRGIDEHLRTEEEERDDQLLNM